MLPVHIHFEMLNIFPFADSSWSITEARQQPDGLLPLDTSISRSEVDVGEDVPSGVLARLVDVDLGQTNLDNYSQ